MPTWSNKLVCPKCGSSDTVDTVRLEQCNACGWSQTYTDAHVPYEFNSPVTYDEE